jgi:hypothetical protein
MSKLQTLAIKLYVAPLRQWISRLELVYKQHQHAGKTKYISSISIAAFPSPWLATSSITIALKLTHALPKQSIVIKISTMMPLRRNACSSRKLARELKVITRSCTSVRRWYFVKTTNFTIQNWRFARKKS